MDGETCSQLNAGRRLINLMLALKYVFDMTGTARSDFLCSLGQWPFLRCELQKLLRTSVWFVQLIANPKQEMLSLD